MSIIVENVPFPTQKYFSPPPKIQNYLRNYHFIACSEATVRKLILSFPFRLAEPIQVFQNERTVCRNAHKRRTAVYIPAVCACVKTLFTDAVTYGAKLVAERRFCAFEPTARAINRFRRNRHPVEFCPQRGGLLTQSVIVRNRRNPRVTFFAVQTATAYKLICVFHR